MTFHGLIPFDDRGRYEFCPANMVEEGVPGGGEETYRILGQVQSTWLAS